MRIRRVQQASQPRDRYEPWDTQVQFPPEWQNFPLVNRSVVDDGMVFDAVIPDIPFSIGGCIELHKGVVYAYAERSPDFENAPNCFGGGTTSSDGGLTWAVPEVWFPDPAPDVGPAGERNRSHGALFSHADGYLYALVSSYLGTIVSGTGEAFPQLFTEVWRRLDLASPWEYLAIVGDGFPLQRPTLMEDGNYIMACGDSFSRPMVMISQGDDFTRPWSTVKLREPQWANPSYSEPTVFVEGRRVLAIVRQPNAGWAATAVSRDYGRSFSTLRTSNLPMENAKPFAMRLSTGHRVLIANIYSRSYLLLFIAEPGQEQFSRMMRWRRDTPPDPELPDPPYNHTVGWAYPWAIELDDHLLISAFENKEGHIFGRIRLDAITRPAEQTDPILRYEFSEETGTTLADSSGNGLDATAYGSVTLSTKNVGFPSPGVGMCVALPTIPRTLLNQISAVTIDVWCQIDSLNSSRTIFAKWVPNVLNQQCIRLWTDNTLDDKLRLQFSASGAESRSVTLLYDAPPLSVMRRYTVKIDNGRVTLLIDNVEQTPTQGSNPIPIMVYDQDDLPWMLGAIGTPDAPSVNMVGKFGRFQIYNRLTTAAEDAALQAYGPNGPPPDYSMYDADAATYFLACDKDPAPAECEAVNDLVVGLKAAGIWSECDIISLPGAHHFQASLLALNRPAQFPWQIIGAPVFEKYKGWTGNGTSDRLQNFFLASTHGVKFAQNDAGFWVWCDTERAADVWSAGTSSSSGAAINPRSVAGNITARINDSTSSVLANPAASSVGLFGVSRVGSAKRFWLSGAQVGSDISVASTGLSGISPWLCGANPDYSTDRVRVVIWSSALTGKEAALSSLLGAYITAMDAIALGA
jgi:hypothetical protein